MTDSAKNTPETIDLLRRINEGTTSSDTPLSEVLRLCMRLGHVLGNQELSAWAKAEASGYTSVDDLPAYRIFETGVQGTFFGPFGSGIKNAPIPQAVVEAEHRDTLFKLHVMQPVGELEEMVGTGKGSKALTVHWSGDAILYYQQKEIYVGYSLASAWRTISTASVAGVLEVIRARVLEFVLAIEQELGVDLASYDKKTPLETPSQDRLTQIFNTTIQGGDNIALGNSGATTQQAVHVRPGDLEGLKEQLAKLGITSELITDLDEAVAKDADDQKQSGQYTQHWLSRVMAMVGRGTLQLASTAASTVVVAEVRRFLGLPPV